MVFTISWGLGLAFLLVPANLIALFGPPAINNPLFLGLPRGRCISHANAVTAGVADRFHPTPGDALRVDLGTGYDLALITNFLPDLESTTNLLKRIHSALEPAGRVAIFELMLNDDRTSPAAAVALNLTLLATTPGGETRTPSELAKSLEGAGFTQTEVRELPRLPNRVMIARR